MSIERVKNYLSKFGLSDRVTEFDVSSATVALAAEALGCEERLIAKSMAFNVKGEPVIVVIAGDCKTDNPKFKAQFGTKAVMIKPDELPELVGHPMGGVCPFDVNSGVRVYLDNSLKRFEYVYPAAGTANSAVKLTLDELQTAVGEHFAGWIDISKMI
ncbi:MAG: YbaK/EbsC family protein [Clostridiales bacterium]|nr:YbaK/EbsC family protein [Clostridiales bacterium]